jgi:hypothetical protein
MKKVLNYWKEFFTDLKIWYRYRKAAVKNEAFLNEKGLRVDWLGRIYTVVNLPEEVENNNIPMVQQGWVLGQLRPINEVLLKIGLADYSYPSIDAIEGSAAYLVVMWPEIDALNIWRFLANFAITAAIAVTVWLGIEVAAYFEVLELIKGLKK